MRTIKHSSLQSKRRLIWLLGTIAILIAACGLIVMRDALKERYLLLMVSLGRYSSDDEMREVIASLGSLRSERAVPMMLKVLGKDYRIDEESSYQDAHRFEYLHDALVKIGEEAVPEILEMTDIAYSRAGGASVLSVAVRNIYQRKRGDFSSFPTICEALEYWAHDMNGPERLRAAASRALQR